MFNQINKGNNDRMLCEKQNDEHECCYHDIVDEISTTMTGQREAQGTLIQILPENTITTSAKESYVPLNEIGKYKEKACESKENQNNNDDQTHFKQTVANIGSNGITNCPSCSMQLLVTNVSDFEAGQHISTTGGYSKLYNHHAIVVEVKKNSNVNVEMVLIHFAKQDGKNVRVCKESQTFDLTEKSVYIVKYKTPKYSMENIVKRAEQVNKELNDKETKAIQSDTDFSDYNLLSCNCEHFATWCVLGYSKSFQVRNFKKRIADALYFFGGSKIAICIRRLLTLPENELAKRLDKVTLTSLALTGGDGVYFIYCIIMTVMYLRNYKAKQICRECLKRALLEIWLLFGTSQLTPILKYATSLLITNDSKLPMMVLEVLISATFKITIGRLRTSLICPFSVDHIPVTDWEQIRVGDAISLPYFGIHAKGIVNESPSRTSDDTGQAQKISIICYWPRPVYLTIGVTSFTLDDTSNIYLLDYKSLPQYPAVDVLERAKSRIDEKKWHFFSNRSLHFTYWAKVKQYKDNIGIIEGKQITCKKTSLYIKQKEIHRPDELSVGDVVKSNAIGYISDTGILSSIVPSKKTRMLSLTVYKLSILGKVVSTECTVDLKKDMLFVKIYSPSLTKKERAKNAEKMCSRELSYFTTESFIEHCIRYCEA